MQRDAHTATLQKKEQEAVIPTAVNDMQLTEEKEASWLLDGGS